jgi:hypothetical protein
MDFEKAYENYKAGMASPEEKNFVENEIDKAKKLYSLIDDLDRRESVIAPANIEDVKRAQKAHAKRSILRIVLIATIVLVLLSGIICAAVFGTAIDAAKKNLNISEEHAKTLALEFVDDNYFVSGDGAVIVTDIDRDLIISGKLKHTTYNYYVEVQNGAHMLVELIVDGKTGLVTLEKIEND